MYYAVYGLVYLFSLLPLPVLYLFADGVYFLLYHVAGYRKAVVMKNLEIAFPEKGDKERRAIARQFYRNFADFFFETIKLFSAGDSFILGHLKADLSLFERLHAEGRGCQVHLGHNFNWELANLAIGGRIPQRSLGVYMPLTNRVMDRIFRKMRAKAGMTLLPATAMKEAMAPYLGERYALFLVADQSPSGPRKAIWTRFFGRPTPFVQGPERGARQRNLPVVFCYFEKLRRGYFHVHFELAEEAPARLPEGELTRRYARYLEDKMRLQPANWLWTHRRWKWDWEPEHGRLYE